MHHTPCFDWHVAHGARMVEFAGWQMPVQYTSIIEEHHAVRSAAGLFDIGHMGRIQFTGPDACRFLDFLVTNDVTRIEVGQIRYALMTNESGGVLDDVLVYRFPEFYFLVVNASNREKICDWIEQHKGPFDVTVEDLTFTRFMAALQGPAAIDILNPLTEMDISQLGYYRGSETTVAGVPAIVSRTGYTGEDGFEVIVANDQSVMIWETLLERGRDVGTVPCGLGCRDTLRLEAAMPLYGHELDESIDPLTAGLGFAVKLNAGEFIGREALVAAKNRDNKKRRVGLVLDSNRIARQGATVLVGDREVGQVTSGTFSPTLQKSIAMAYVEPGFADVGQTLQVDIRGKRHAAAVVSLPFYKRS